MASSLPTSSCSLNTSPSPCLYRHKVSLKLKQPQVRSQSFKDEGKSADMVEANLCVLRRRIEEVKKKEKEKATTSGLNEQYCSCRYKNGWNYQGVCHDHHHHHKHEKITDRVVSESTQILGAATGAVGLVFLTGSLFIFLVSFLVHSF